ncbi:voltage-gated potassium channel [Streptomyces sp. yr375]|uniref:potassium channel family protein n=1 Tax=Streptomyces sp. yr375 TaxID=1761906 RepID=UPI0008CAF4BD|nr:potassium channel family protein [Streptomyces sp. yr375]SER16443.1 voltage-gated potassium channel [Streptomyces sp. yr375]
MDANSRTARWEEHVELPLALASLLYLAAYAVHVLVPGMSAGWHTVCLTVLFTMWAAFGVDYAVRWRLSGRRLGFVRTHWLDTLVLFLPLLRPLRIVKVYESMERRRGTPRLSLHARVAAYAGLATLLLGFSGALAVYQQERYAPGASIRTFGDSLWWTCSTLATVGYGDVVPVTEKGRIIAVGMMACGLALLGAVTGSFSSWLVQVFALESDKQEGPPGK